MYLIDGNNVIGQRVGWHRDKPGSRRRFLEELALLVRAKKMRIAVVFDGAPDQSFPDGSTYRGVKLYYAKPGLNADNRIIEMVEAEKNRKGLMVVTSDGALASYVRTCGVGVMRSGEFRRMLERVIAGIGEQQIGVEDEVREIDSWFRYFGVDKKETDDADE
jgi:uncharacterized protein